MSKDAEGAHLADETDLVDRIFEYLAEERLDLPSGRLEELKAAVRFEFRGERAYIRSRDAQDHASRVLSLFNGRNAAEVARRLGIGRTTVFRILKQARSGSRPTFAVNGTQSPVRSRPRRRAEGASENKD